MTTTIHEDTARSCLEGVLLDPDGAAVFASIRLTLAIG